MVDGVAHNLRHKLEAMQCIRPDDNLAANESDSDPEDENLETNLNVHSAGLATSPMEINLDAACDDEPEIIQIELDAP